MKWFNDLCKDVDLLKSDTEETHRYMNFPKFIWDSDRRLKQWVCLRMSSKWEWLQRQRFMHKDKFRED